MDHDVQLPRQSFPFSHPFWDKVFAFSHPFETKILLYTPQKTVHGQFENIPPNTNKKNNAFLSMIWAAPQIKRVRGFRLSAISLQKSHFFCPGPWKGCLYLRNTKKARGKKGGQSSLFAAFYFFLSPLWLVQISRSTFHSTYGMWHGYNLLHAKEV